MNQDSLSTMENVLELHVKKDGNSKVMSVSELNALLDLLWRKVSALNMAALNSTIKLDTSAFAMAAQQDLSTRKLIILVLELVALKNTLLSMVFADKSAVLNTTNLRTTNVLENLADMVSDFKVMFASENHAQTISALSNLNA